MKTITVIGGGASGLIASIYAKTRDTEVILLERNSIFGKKILATGNGRCNYWNLDQDLSHYNSSDKSLLESIITKENKDEIMQRFTRMGIFPRIKNGYFYPYSNQAVSVRNALVVEAKRVGVELISDVYVEDIQKEKEKYIVTYNNQTISCDAIIIATGSKAAPKTGSDGNGYHLVHKLNHTVIKPLPALVQLRANTSYLKDWDGIRSDVKITLVSNNKKIKEESGEIQLTNYGISGICIFNLSSLVSRLLDCNQKVSVIINFLPFIQDDAITWLEERNSIVIERNVVELLEGLLNNKLIMVILNICKIDPTKSWEELTTKERKLLAKKLTQFQLDITGTNSFDQAQVCSGGVPLSEINPNTMESIYAPNLYIVGELLDVDASCGGYNLSFAWISGMLAGKGSRRCENVKSKTN